MSKNFELLQHISNEKGLFQTLDGGKDTREAFELIPEGEAGRQDKASQESSLPDVFRTVNETPGPIADFPAQPSHNVTPPEEQGRGEAQEIQREERYPISRNPITPLNSVPAAPACAKPEIEPQRSAEFTREVEAHLGLGTPKRMAVYGARSNAQRGAEERGRQGGPPWQRIFRPELRASSRMDGNNSIGNRWKGRVQPRNVYKDAKRELIAREEEFKLVQRVFLGAAKNAPHVALFSGLEHDGACASLCLRAGEILATQTEEPVCLVEANFRVPLLHQYCGLQNERGLAEATQEPRPIQEFAQQISPPNFWLVSAGQSASGLNLATAADRLRARMEELRDEYRYVIVHSGPLWLNAEAMMLSKWTDGVVLILEANSSRRDAARRIKESLAAANAKVLGVVLNNRSYPIPESLYCRL